MKRFFFLCFFVMILTIPKQSIIHADSSTEPLRVVYSEKLSEETESTESPVTIKEMKENLEGLKTEKAHISDKWENLNAINGKVVDYLRNDLSDSDIGEIQNLSIAYQRRSIFYENQLRDNSFENYNTDSAEDNDTSVIKQNFIDYKINFYKALVPFIDISKKSEYLEYIKGNLVIEKEEKDIKEKIYKQEGVIEERVDTIKEKIKEHNKYLEKKLEQLIRKRITEKINSIFASEKMQQLTYIEKSILLEKVSERLISNKEKLIASTQDSEFLRKKIEIYDIAIEVIQTQIKSLTQ